MNDLNVIICLMILTHLPNLDLRLDSVLKTDAPMTHSWLNPKDKLILSEKSSQTIYKKI